LISLEWGAAVFEIGTSLREARLRQSLDFPEIEQGTKIRSKYLRALEDEQFDVLPAQTYVKGFLRSYAEYLGLDGQLYVDEYNSRFVVGEEEPSHRPRRSAPPSRGVQVQSRVVLLTLLGIAAVTALVIVAWTRGEPQKETPVGLGQNAGTNTPTKQPAAQTRQGVRLVVTAETGSSWILVQRNPPSGPVIFKNWIDLGKTMVFGGRTLRLEATTPQALTLKLNGRTVQIPDRVRAVIVRQQGLAAAPH
jgi:cytoskeleton protein RodZ